MLWEDYKTHTTGTEGRVEPRTWRLKGVAISIWVRRYARHTGWWLSSTDLGIESYSLGDVPIEEAQARATKFLREFVQTRKQQLDRVLEVVSEEPIRTWHRHYRRADDSDVEELSSAWSFADGVVIDGRPCAAVLHVQRYGAGKWVATLRALDASGVLLDHRMGDTPEEAMEAAEKLRGPYLRPEWMTDLEQRLLDSSLRLR